MTCDNLRLVFSEREFEIILEALDHYEKKYMGLAKMTKKNNNGRATTMTKIKQFTAKAEEINELITEMSHNWD